MIGSQRYEKTGYRRKDHETDDGVRIIGNEVLEVFLRLLQAIFRFEVLGSHRAGNVQDDEQRWRGPAAGLDGRLRPDAGHDR